MKNSKFMSVAGKYKVAKPIPVEKIRNLIYRRSYIDASLLIKTREFSDEEIKKWQQDDSL